MATTTFKSLTDTTFDSVEGYRQAAEKADSPQLKQALAARGQQREQTLQQMNAELERQGDELVTKGTLSGEELMAARLMNWLTNDEAVCVLANEYLQNLSQKLQLELLKIPETQVVAAATVGTYSGEFVVDEYTIWRQRKSGELLPN